MMKSQRAVEILFCYLLPVIFLGAFLFTSVSEIRYGLHRDYAEGTTLSQVEFWRSHIKEPRTVYSSEINGNGPMMGYPFIHLGLLSLLSDNAPSSLAWGRIISGVCALAICLVAWLILQQTMGFGVKFLPLVASLTLYQSAVYDWSLMARADLLAYLFEILGFYFYLREWNKDKFHWKTFLFFAASFFTKQNFILGPVVFIIFELSYHRRTFLKKIPVYLAASAAVFTLVTLLFGTGYWQQTLVQLAQLHYWGRLFQIYSTYLIAHILFIILVVIFLNRKDVQDKLKVFLTTYTLTGLFIAALAMGRSGSNINYFICVAVPVALMAVIALRGLIEDSKAAVWTLVLIPLFIQIFVEVTPNRYQSMMFVSHRVWPPTLANPGRSIADVRKYLESIQAKNVFCDEPGTCALLGYQSDYFYFEQRAKLSDHVSPESYDVFLFTDLPGKNLTWTSIKLPVDIIPLLQEKYELSALTELGLIYRKKSQ